jgi:TrmH family RNA methyltransferase
MNTMRTDPLLLTSRSNERVRLAAAVSKSAKARRENGLFFLEGARLCGDAAASGTVVSLCLYTDAAAGKYADALRAVVSAAREVYRITDALSDYLGQTEHPQGIFCLCEMREADVMFDPHGKYMAFSELQNPDNLGAFSRTAEALGLSGLVLEGGCDLYSPKALRASMGSLLRLPVLRVEDLAAFLADCRASGMRTYASTPDSSAESVTTADFSGGVVCVVGNEGAGLSDELLSTCTPVTIPMTGRAESFNAAAAAAILAWEMVR